MKKSEIARSIILGGAAGLVLAVVFAAGFLVRDLTQAQPVRAEGSNYAYPLLGEVQRIIDQVYLRPQPDATQRDYGAIRGMLAVLGDGNTFFIEPPVARSEADVLAGTYGGIGVLLRRDELGQFLLAPYPDSPALAAGIVDGDVLLAINGTPVQPTDQQDAVDQQLRGEVKAGSGVEITIRSVNEEKTLFILFDVINVPSVLWRVLAEDERIGYIQILRFTNRTPDELKTAVAELKAQGIAASVVDMRNNTGGLLDESIQVAGQFFDGGVIAYEKSKGDERTFEAPAGGVLADLPLVVLVNNRTASAAEIVAGAIQSRGRGILIGQKTYGKGTVQQIYTLSDGSSIHVTSAEWFTPSRAPLDGVGLEPDIAMIPAEDGRDVESGEALRHLQSLLSRQETTP